MQVRWLVTSVPEFMLLRGFDSRMKRLKIPEVSEWPIYLSTRKKTYYVSLNYILDSTISTFFNVWHLTHDCFIDSHCLFSSKKNLYNRFMAGSLAGVTSQSITYPLDLARARMAVTAKAEYKSLIEVSLKLLF